MGMTLKRKGATSFQSGFTLIELLVAMAISLVVMAAVYSTYMSQQKAYMVQDQVSATQQNLRAAMYVMTRDIRMAGFDPEQSGNFGIADSQGDTITFSYDRRDDGTLGTLDTDETITYSLSGTDLIRTVGTSSQVVAENIAKVGFGYSYDSDSDGLAEVSADSDIIWAVDSGTDQYLDEEIDGTTLGSTVSIENIKAVKIWLLARTDKTIQNYHSSDTYQVGTSVVTPVAGYMYRLLTETAKCRNL